MSSTRKYTLSPKASAQRRANAPLGWRAMIRRHLDQATNTATNELDAKRAAQSITGFYRLHIGRTRWRGMTERRVIEYLRTLPDLAHITVKPEPTIVQSIGGETF